MRKVVWLVFAICGAIFVMLLFMRAFEPGLFNRTTREANLTWHDAEVAFFAGVATLILGAIGSVFKEASFLAVIAASVCLSYMGLTIYHAYQVGDAIVKSVSP